MKLPSLPRLSDHGSEVVLLGLIAAGVLWVLRDSIRNAQMIDVAAFLLILQRIVEAIQKRWEQRSIDRMGASLANAPPSDPPATSPDQVPVRQPAAEAGEKAAGGV